LAIQRYKEKEADKYLKRKVINKIFNNIKKNGISNQKLPDIPI
jgi:hypothetical protein